MKKVDKDFEKERAAASGWLDKQLLRVKKYNESIKKYPLKHLSHLVKELETEQERIKNLSALAYNILNVLKKREEDV